MADDHPGVFRAELSAADAARGGEGSVASTAGAVDVVDDFSGGCNGRTRGEHCRWSSDCHDFCSVAMGSEDVFPYTILLQTVPILAVAPLIIIWVGPGLLAVGVVTFVICLAPIIANTTQGLVSVDENLVQFFLMHNASPGTDRIEACGCLTALPYLFVGRQRICQRNRRDRRAHRRAGLLAPVRLGMVGSGYSILYAQAQLQAQIDLLFALVIAATALGICIAVLR
jgi:hypothetical protein